MRTLAAGSALLLGLALAAGSARASCGAEGCPFVREGLGPGTDRVGFGLHFQQVTQDELWEGSAAADRDELIAEAFATGGLHSELELYTYTRSWVAEARARLHDRLLATVTLPWHEREHRHMLVHAPFFDPRFVDTWSYEGLGDAIVLGHFRALALGGARPGNGLGSALTLEGGVKLPTGRRHVPDEERTNSCPGAGRARARRTGWPARAGRRRSRGAAPSPSPRACAGAGTARARTITAPGTSSRPGSRRAIRRSRGSRCSGS
jgi:hypothetical protein